MMKKIIVLLGLLFSMHSFAVWDMLTNARPNREFMNFFYQGYIPWYEKTFSTSLELPGKDGKEFFLKAVKYLDHWKVPGSMKFDQLLIGQSFYDGKPSYRITIYLHPELRDESYLKQFKLSFKPQFIEYKNKDLCFGRIVSEDIVSYQCKNKTLEKKWLKSESGHFPSSIAGLSEWEILETTDGKPSESFFHIKNFHLASVPKEFYPLIMKHGATTHMPVDKYSIDSSGKWTIYYP